MMYPFMTLNDETEIVHSDMQNDGRVKVYIERPDEKYGFKHATCWLPDYTLHAGSPITHGKIFTIFRKKRLSNSKR